MLLDLDQGTMTIYKNDKWLGVMATGLSGEYCWAVAIDVHSGRKRASTLPHCQHKCW
jgi:hypothetical protein